MNAPMDARVKRASTAGVAARGSRRMFETTTVSPRFSAAVKSDPKSAMR
jgi:hypothetical protein